jgi:hypothetical protein
MKKSLVLRTEYKPEPFPHSHRHHEIRPGRTPRSELYLPKRTKSTTRPTATMPRREGGEIARADLTDGGALASAGLERRDRGEDEGEGQEAAERNDGREGHRAPVPSGAPPASPASPSSSTTTAREWRRRRGRLRRDADLHGVDDAIAAGDGDTAHARRDPQLHPPPPPPPPK